ncbi:MAG TPA: hypothetical protein VN157_02145, partial [Caulobacter sp.]|nr:hypothetical protein [Caulobacter sp.]
MVAQDQAVSAARKDLFSRALAAAPGR